MIMPYQGSTTLADVIRGLRVDSLPASGRHFVSTLNDRKLSTVKPGSAGSAPTVTYWRPNAGAVKMLGEGILVEWTPPSRAAQGDPHPCVPSSWPLSRIILTRWG